MEDTILEVKNLKQHFAVKKDFLGRPKSWVKAVDDVTFSVRRNEVLGIVGESGCGKTTVGRTIVRLYEPTGGQILYTRPNGETVDFGTLDRHQMKPFRRDVRMIFQDPFSSLDPRFTVKDLISEPLVIHGEAGTPAEAGDRVAVLMREVGLNPDMMNRYPHEFSGGQRQRIGIARTLALRPRLVVADEPVSALDVSIQAQVLNLLQNLKDELGLTVLFVAHDISVVEHISDRIAVMYVGKLAELAPTEDLLKRPLHPYTEALVSSIPPADPDVKTSRIRLEGDVPSPINPPPGCVFHTRCRHVKPHCSASVPEYREVEPGRWVACHRAGELTLRGLEG